MALQATARGRGGIDELDDERLARPAVLAGMSDGAVYDIIVKGKDKMIGEGDRLPPEKAWNMVNYVRSFAKKEGAEKTPAAAPKS